MYLWVTTIRRVIAAPSALLVVIALQHCLWEGAMAVRHAQFVASFVAAGEPLPIGMPKPGCDNESGCICRGATIVQITAVIAPPTFHFGHFLTAEGALQPEWLVEEAVPIRVHDGLHGPPPVSGRILRAHLSSLVI